MISNTPNLRPPPGKNFVLCIIGMPLFHSPLQVLTNEQRWQQHKRASCVIWYADRKSSITVERNFQRTYKRTTSDIKTIKTWFDKFLAKDNINQQPGSRMKPTLEKTIEEIREASNRSPTTPIRRVFWELHISRATVHKVQHKRLRMHTFQPSRFFWENLNQY